MDQRTELCYVCLSRFKLAVSNWKQPRPTKRDCAARATRPSSSWMASRACKDIRKAHEELQDAKQSQLDPPLLQLSKFKDHEEKYKEEQKIMRERKEKLMSELARVQFELELTSAQQSKASATLEKTKENFFFRKLVELEMISEMYDRLRVELRRVQSECDCYRIECETQKEEVDRIAARLGKYQVQKERTKEEQDKLAVEAERYKDRLARKGMTK